MNTCLCYNNAYIGYISGINLLSVCMMALHDVGLLTLKVFVYVT